MHTSNTKRKFLTVICLVLFVLIGAYGSYLIYRHYRSQHDSTVQTGPTKAQIKQSSDVDKSTKEQAANNNVGEKSTGQQPSTTPTPPPSTAIELSTRQESNGNITISTKLFAISSGSCALTVVNGAKTASQTAQVIYQPQFSTCAGFSVARDNLGTGTWNITLKVTSNVGTETKSTTIEVK